MEAKVEDINDELRAARASGEELAQLLLLFDYFIKHTPEGRAVEQELERDWRETCARLRDAKRLVGADFTLAEWLAQVRKELLLQRRPAKSDKKVKPARAPRKKTLRFRGVD